MGIRLIREEDDTLFDNISQLSYLEESKTSIRLYIDGIYKGNVKVWVEDETERKYISLNYETIYLDSITQGFSY